MTAFQRRLVVLFVAVLLGSRATAQSATTSIAAVLAADSTSMPKFGDTVTIAARVSLANGVLDTARTLFYLQEGQRGIRIYGTPKLGRVRARGGDSVVVTGIVQLYRGEREVTALRIDVIPVSARVLAPVRLADLSPSSVAKQAHLLVTVSGTVVSRNTGRGDHTLRIAADGTAGDTASIAVTESSRGAVDLGFDRFGPGDQVAVTGVLVTGVSLEGASRYEVFPATKDDIRATALTARQEARTRQAVAGLAVGVAVVLLAMAYRTRRRDREESERTARIRRESEERFRQLVEEAPMGMVVYHRGRILFANAAFAHIAGIDYRGALRDTRIVDLIHENDRAPARDHLAALVPPAEAVYRFQKQFRRQDGKRIELRVVSSPISFEGLSAMQAIVLDVTEQVALEVQLTQAQKMEAVGQLAAGVAHDFNNLLTVIMSCSSLALMTLPEGAEAIGDIEAIAEASERARVLTSQLLAFSRKQILQPRSVDVSTTVQSVAGMLRRVMREDIAIELDAAATWTVSADPGQLEQVVMNLALNARDAIPHGGVIHLRTANVEVTAADPHHVGLSPGRYATIEVEDNGTGIEPSVLPHLFEPFFTTKEAGKGTGLGLATVYGIVKQSGGFVYATSTLGMGSRFSIYLPHETTSAPAEVQAPPSETFRGTGTILLVEDDASVSAVAQRILERNGHRVLTAINGIDGLRQLSMADKHRMHIDLVLSDVVMPGLDGAGFGEYVRIFWPALPVLYMSGYTEERVVRKNLPGGIAVFLDKPFTPETLLAAVQSVFAPRQSGARSEHEHSDGRGEHDDGRQSNHRAYQSRDRLPVHQRGV